MVQFLDPETTEILPFLDPEIIKMDKKNSGSINRRNGAISGYINRRKGRQILYLSIRAKISGRTIQELVRILNYCTQSGDKSISVLR